MAIKITENGNVHYVNEDDVNRTLFKNIETDFSNAIAELNEKVNDLIANKDNIKITNITKDVTITANTHTNIDIPYNRPNGYTIASALVQTTPNASWVFANTQAITSDKIVIGVYNTSATDVTGMFRVIIILTKN